MADKHNTRQRRASVLSNEQQNMLERSLASRPSPSALQNAGIARQLDGGRFAAEKARLERALAASSLSRELQHRPDLVELEHAGIAPSTHVAPSLAGLAKRLEKRLIADTLNQSLYAREAAAGNTEAERHLKATDVAPRLRKAKLALEHAITRDKVGHKLEVRPDVTHLMHSGVLPSPVSGRIAAVQRELGKRYTKDRVGHLLEQRPDLLELEKEGVLRDVSIAPALQGVQKRLQHQLAKSNLYHGLQNRPSVAELAERGLWRPNEKANYYESDSDDSDDDDDDEHRHAHFYPHPNAPHVHVLMSPSSAAHRAAFEAQQADPAQSPSTTASIAGIAAAEAAYRQYQQQAAQQQHAQQQYEQQQQEYAQQQYAYQQQQQQQQQQQYASADYGYGGHSYSQSARRSRSFHLTRLLLKFVSHLSAEGSISAQQKSLLKELIVDGVAEVFDAAERFDQTNDLYHFKSTLLGFAQGR